jgi:hypothetical protein
VKLSDFARYSVDGPVLTSCDRCGEGEYFGPGGEDVGLTDLVAWAQHHVCPQSATAMPARELVAV